MVRARAKSRRTRNEDEVKLIAAVTLTLIALVAGGVGVYFWATAPRPPARDQKTFCQIEGPRAIAVMLLDTTDPLPVATKEQVFKLLTDIADDLREYALLDIRILDSESQAGRQIFSLCNPGDGRGLNEFNGNPSLAKRVWQRKFHEPLEQALEGGLHPRHSDTSPLLSTLQGIAISRFTGKAAAEVPKLLVIVSDMIENTKEYSQYEGDLSYRRFKMTPTYFKYRTDLNKAQVQIFYVQRIVRGRSPIDSGAHIRFWIDWVQDSGGQFKSAIKLQGA
jgi:hypothetical protein